MHKDDGLPCENSHRELILRNAAEYGQMEVVSHLLEDQKLDIDAADEGTGLTALHFAARTDQFAVVQLLMDREADRTKSDRLGRTALHHAVQGREARCFEFLLHRNADTGLRDLEGMTIWHLAAQGGNVEALSILLSRPADAALAIGVKENAGRTPFLCASSNGSKEAMRLLLSAGSSLAEIASDGSSSLHYAAESGSLEAVKFLIREAVDPCAPAHDGSSAIHYAVSGKSEELAEIVRLLLEYGVDPCKARNDECTPLHDLLKMIKERLEKPYKSEVDHLFAACRILAKRFLETPRPASDQRLCSELLYLACLDSGPTAHETILSLLELGLDCNIPSANGETALMAAAKKGDDAIFSALLLHGADPCVSAWGLSALHWACFNDHKSIIVRLRESSIDWNGKTASTILGIQFSNVTALHIAAQVVSSSVLEYLLNENLMSNVDARTDKGVTPLIVAVWARTYRNVSILLSKSADTTIIDDWGNGAIHWAVQHGDEEMVSEFMTHGSDLGLPNNLGLTPELVARKHGHQILAKDIMDYVKKQNYEVDATINSQIPSGNHGLSESLKVAIDIGDLELCKRLVDSGVDLTSGVGWCMGCPPLLYSLHKGQIAIAEYLVSRGASAAGSTCESWSTRGFTPFHYAAALGCTELLRLLLEKAPSEVYLCQDPIHPIHLAVYNEKAGCVKLILDHASQGKGKLVLDQMGTLQEALDRIVNRQVRGDMFRWTWHALPEEAFPEALETARSLHIAARKGFSHIASMLLEHGASMECLDNEYKTPLHYAAAEGQTAMTKLLLDSGANSNAVDIGLESPLTLAASYGCLEVCQVLIKNGADIRLRNRYCQTALSIAAEYGAKDVFMFLINTAAGYDLGEEDVVGRSVLYEAMRQTSIFSLGLLFSLPLPTRFYESRRDTILNVAIVYRSTNEVKMLIRRLKTSTLSGFLDYRGRNSGTPLHVAAVLSKLDTMNLLLDAGAQLELEGSEHGTPLMAACATGRLAAVKLLVARGARTSYVKDGRCYSAFLAAKYHPEVRRWLLIGRFLGPKLLTYDVEELSLLLR